MSFSCVFCGKEARYMFKGTSLCKDHLDKEMKEIKNRSREKHGIMIINAPEVPE